MENSGIARILLTRAARYALVAALLSLVPISNAVAQDLVWDVGKRCYRAPNVADCGNVYDVKQRTYGTGGLQQTDTLEPRAEGGLPTLPSTEIETRVLESTQQRNEMLSNATVQTLLREILNREGAP